AEIDDVGDSKIFDGPRSRHDAETTLRDMGLDDHKIVQVKGSGGSLTALPIIETLLGDVSSYIPTNVISITDGQIYLENNLFNAGIRPAVNVGISVSRVGGDAQTRAMKQVAARLRLDMAVYRELAAFAQFGSDLDKATQSQLSRGQRLQEILKQPQYEPISMGNQVIVLFAGTRGYADDVPLESVRAWETGLLKYMDTNHPEIGKDILENKRITEATEQMLGEAIKNYNLGWIH
ncbi:MAG: F0F1 ATP synthase subunit alpha, partial [Chloroflexi bacterium]|nr:F0F1 ATP synthase subunit alpha [Chloroflexota bacterium]